MNDGPTQSRLLSQSKRQLLARLMKREGVREGEREAIPRRTQISPCPLSFAQQRLWFIDQLEPGSVAYNVPVAVRLRGELDVEALGRALSGVVARHESLRTSFARADGGGDPAQFIHPARPLPLPLTDLTALPPAAREGEARRLAAAAARRPFDLGRAPLLRARLLRLAADEHLLVLVVHHIVSDGWSMRVLVRELSALYLGHARAAAPDPAHARADAAPPPDLPDLPVQYADYAVWQRQHLDGPALDGHLAYWRERLRGPLPVLQLPADRPRPRAATHRGGRVTRRLSPDLAGRLKELSRGEGVTLFMTLLAGFAAVLSRHTGQEDIIVGTPIANRHRVEVEGLVGFFVNTLALRTDLGGDPTFRELLGRVRETALGAYRHQEAPFERVVEAVEAERDLRRAPLFQVMLVMQEAAAAGVRLGGLEVSAEEVETGAAKFDLLVGVQEGAGGWLEVAADYSAELFEGARVGRLLGHLEVLLESAAGGPWRRVSELEMLGEGERRELLAGWNETGREYEREASVHGMFEREAARRPGAVAVVSGGEAVTYGELDGRADEVARRLVAAGVGLEDRVGVMAERGAWMVAGLLGVLKAGGAYVPLDAEYPAGRLRVMMEDAGVRVVAATRGMRGRVPETGAAVVWLDEEGEGSAPRAAGDDSGCGVTAGNPSVAVAAGNLAYVIYTSGSTGIPKGVSVTHRSIMRLVRETNYARFGEDEVFLQFAPISFDASTLEIWGSLINGGRLVLMPPGMTTLEALGEVVRREGVTTMWLTAGLFHLMVDERLDDLRGVRQLLAGGDVLSVAHVKKYLDAAAAGRVLINGYGPTENTTFTCCFPMTAATQFENSVPIGRPISNTQVYVLDRNLRPVAQGVVGELMTGGDGLARGYLNRPAQTAERFIPHPFSETPGARLYRTGDLVRYLSDGNLEFVGRMDQQVKIRGFRIELEEIEMALAAHAAVREAIVIAREDVPGDKRIVAYLVAAPDSTPPSPGELHKHLREKLPEYMLPAAFVWLDELPLTANGKVNRSGLPAPGQGHAEVEGVYVAPRTPVEEIVAGIWRDALRVERVGVDDNFFELGGHSLLATQVVSRVREALGVEIALRSLFECGTVGGLSEVIERALKGRTEVHVPAVLRVERGVESPLSYAQQRLWFLDQLDPDSPAYNVPVAVRVKGRLDAAALARSLNEIVLRHESLRTGFSFSGGQPVQVSTPGLSLEMPLIDLTAHPEGGQEALRLAREEARQPFDLRRPPLARARLIRLNAEEHVLLLTMHHIVSDGWSMGVLIREMAALYEAFAQGLPSPLAELPVQYADFAAWQREQLQGAPLERQLSYWRERLSDAPAQLELPTDRARPAVQSHRGAVRRFRLGRELTDELKTLSRREGVTLFMTLLAAFDALLARYTGQEDIVVGTPIANRHRVEVEGLIGFFVNTLALRTDLGGDPTFRELLGRVRETALGAYAHQEMPFERLVEELQPERDLGRTPLYQVMFIFQNTPVELLTLPQLSFEPVDVYSGTVKVDLVLNMQETADGLSANIEYSAELFEAGTVERMVEHFENLLREAAKEPGRRVSELAIIGEAERRRLLEEWDEVGAYREHTPLHRMFEEQVERNPDGCAVAFQNERVSYRELDARSNQLARGLRALNIERGQGVGIMLGTGPSQIVALLGVLKAGCYFVCIDPEHPASRQQRILEEVAPPCVITEAACLRRRAELWRQLRREGACSLLLMDEGAGTVDVVDAMPPDRSWLDAQDATRPDVEVNPRDIAYVVYTSGSSGRPKGIAQSHNSFSQFAEWMGSKFRIESGKRVAQWASITYDAAYAEILGALCHGATLCMATADVRSDPRAVAEWLEREAVSVLVTVPSFCSQVFDVLGERGGSGGARPPLNALEFVLLAGETLPTKLARAWLDRYPRRPKLYNLYGPTESVLATFHEVARGDDERRSIPIGRAIDGRQILILDAGQRLCPVGTAGELYVRSPYLTNGYFRNPEETLKRFVQNPLHDNYRDEVYRTGDLARWLPDGNIEFFGRIDNQVKVRGIRVELEEIEAALLRHEAVSECAVAAHEYEDGDRRLVGYVVADDSLTAAALREFAEAWLPGYMLPSTFVFLDSLPRTSSGKIERGGLPKPDATARGEAGDHYVAPRTPVEAGIAEVWREFLGVERVGVDDDFFRLGGHSLLATRVMNRVRGMYAVEIPLRDFIGAPTVASLSRKVESARQTGGASAEQIAALLEKVKALSDEEVRALLNQPHGPQSERHDFT